MSDRIKYAISVTPIEELTGENGETHDILSGEVGTTLGGDGLAVVADYSQTGEGQGYSNGAVSYLEAIDSSDLTDISPEPTASFIFIKNTGFTFSSPTVLGVALTASLKVMSDTALLAVLDAGECIVFKDDNRGLDCREIHVRTVETDGTNGTPGHLAVEFLVVD